MTPAIVAAALSILTLGSAPAASEAPTTVAPATAVAPKPVVKGDPDKVICKTDELTGSRFQKRICATRAQWAEAELKQQQRTDDFFRHANDNAGLQRSEYGAIPANGVSQAQIGSPY